MEKRETTLHDGRYLIFYTFDDHNTKAAPSALDVEENKEGVVVAKSEPQVKPEAEEEKGV